MSTTAKSLLKELYILDPSLSEKEQEILQIIELMKKNQPKIKINEAFRLELRTKLMDSIDYAYIKKTNTNTFNWSLFFSIFGTAFASIFVGVLGWNMYLWIPAKTTRISFVPKVTTIAQEWFGNPIITQTHTVSSLWMGKQMSPHIENPEIGVMYMPTNDSIWNTTPRIDTPTYWKMMTSDTSVPAETPIYRYSYSGSITLETWELPVYKKEGTAFTTDEMRWVLQNFPIDAINLWALQNTILTNINLSEERDYGYNIAIDLNVGNISFSQNYPKWPQAKCDMNGCAELPKITEKDLLQNNEIVDIANNWLQKYGIDKTFYGNAKIEMPSRAIKSWEEQLHVPDIVTITYPLLINSKEVYEEYGTYKWIILTLDIRSKQISGMYGLEKQNLIQSLYPSESNTGNIMNMLYSGGRYMQSWTISWNQKIVTIPVSAPHIEYVHISSTNTWGTSDEYYVPAYVFDVIEKPKDGHISNSVIVPAVRGFTVIEDTVSTPIPELMR